MIVRTFSSEDANAVDRVHRAAFASTAYGHDGEADLVRALHRGEDTLVSLVALIDGEIIGHILFTRLTAVADGVHVPAAALAPLAVLPAHHRRGIGAALVRAGHEALIERGIAMSFVLGDPAYYGRFGYSADLARAFASPYAGAHYMALLLDKDMPVPQQGSTRHSAAFG